MRSVPFGGEGLALFSEAFWNCFVPGEVQLYLVGLSSQSHLLPTLKECRHAAADFGRKGHAETSRQDVAKIHSEPGPSERSFMHEPNVEEVPYPHSTSCKSKSSALQTANQRGQDQSSGGLGLPKIKGIQCCNSGVRSALLFGVQDTSEAALVVL